MEQTVAANQAGQDAADDAAGKRRGRGAARPNRNHGALPAHLPRDEGVIDIEHRDGPCCGGSLQAIGELRTEQLDIAPAQLRVRVTRRPRYVCRSCDGVIAVAPAPERPIDGGMATEALIVHVVVSKFCDGLPLYRQTQMLARQGATLDRSTLSNWVGRACWCLTPLSSSARHWPRPSCSPMIRRCRCSIPVVAGPRRGVYGVMRSTIDHGAAKAIRLPRMCIPRITGRAVHP